MGTHFLNNKYTNLKFGDYVITDFFVSNKADYLPKNNVFVLGGILGKEKTFAATFIVTQKEINSKVELIKIVNNYNAILQKKEYFFILFVVDEDGVTVIPQNDEKDYYDIDDIKNLIDDKKTVLENSFKNEEKNNNVIDKNNVSNEPFYYIYDKDKSHEVHKKYSKISNIEKLFEQEFSYMSFLGPIVKLCFKFNPVSEYDFVNQYFSSAESNKKEFVKERGLTRFEVMEMTTRFQRRVGEVSNTTITHEDAFHYIMWNIINFAFSGFEAEKAYAELLYKNGYITSKADDELDEKYGVDIVVKNKNEQKFYVQVKPNSFLSVNKKKEREDAYEKYNKTLKKYNIKTYYAFYTRSTDGKLTWKEDKETGKTLFDVSILTKY
jgi:hypothetical protein